MSAEKETSGAVERIVAVVIKWRGICHTAEAPRRHHHVIREMAQRGFGPECIHNQGFLTNRGCFVDRKEGMKIARAAGQLIRITGSPDTLFSEDLWLTPTSPASVITAAASSSPGNDVSEQIWIKIEKGLPVPKNNPGGRNWENRHEAKIPWKQLEPGDSVFVAGCQGSRGAQLVKSANKRRADARFIGRTVQDGYRIWRIE